MLKEELQKAPASLSRAAMIEIGREISGKIVDEKEVLRRFEGERNTNEVVDSLTKLIDHGIQQRTLVERQLDRDEKQLEALIVLSNPGLETEEGLPMMDIEEELDEDGGVVSSSVTQPGKAAPELLEALRKAGVYKAEKNRSATEKTTSTSQPPTTSTATNNTASAKKTASVKSSPEIVPKATEPPPKKSVAFADDVQVKTFEKLSGIEEKFRGWNLKPGSRIYELGDDEEVIGKHIVPVDESADEAQLRREMIEYGLSEAGQVVAEMDIEELDEFDDDDDDYDEDEDSDEDEDEDEHGRSTRPVITEEYRQQMMELEKKLNARMVENIGPRPDPHPLADVADDVRSLRIRKDEDFDESMAASKPEEEVKSVRFAGTAADTKPTESPAKPSAPTISETIVERVGPAPRAPTAPSKPAKVSRFKSERATPSEPPPMLPNPPVPEAPPIPTGPVGRALADTVLEHTPQPSEPHVPDEFDPVLLNREIHTEYHKLRNKMIQQQGGFKETEEERDDPLMEERDGKTKKVSRFMAARLKADGGYWLSGNTS